jgi:perosamine synthetase
VAAGFQQAGAASELLGHLATYGKSTLYQRPWYGLVGYPVGRLLDRKLNLTAKDGFSVEAMPPGTLRVIQHRLVSFREKIDRQRHHAQYFLQRLEVPLGWLPSENSGCVSNWFQFPLHLESQTQRDALADHLFQKGIDSAKYLDEITDVARSLYGYQGDCPVAEKCAKTTLLVPIYYTLSERDLDRVIAEINEFAQGSMDS